MIRLLIFCLLVLFATTGPTSFFVFLALVYTLIYAGLEILLVGFFVDAYFLTTFYTVPYTTLGLGVLLSLVHLIRPHLSMYNR